MTEQEESAPNTWRPRSRRIFRAAFVVLAIALLVVAVVRQGPELWNALQQIDMPTILGAFACVLVGLVSNMLSWRALLSGLGSRLPVSASARIFFLAQLGKYLPGSVWPVLAQVELGREHDVPAARSGAAAAVNMVLNLVTGILVGIGAVAITNVRYVADYWWTLLPLPILLLMLHPRVISWLVMRAMRLLRRPAVDVELSTRALIVATAWSVFMWLALGSQIAVLSYGMGARSSSLVLVSIGAYALSWVVGFLVVIAPAGAGARELALVVTLGQVLTPAAALAIALVSRIVSTLGDLVVASAAVIAERLHRKHAQSDANTSDCNADSFDVTNEDPGKQA